MASLESTLDRPASEPLSEPIEPNTPPGAAGFFLQLDPQEREQAAELHTRLREPMFSLKQAGISPALYLTWHKAGIVPDAAVGTESKLTFLEYLWLRMARELVLQGLPMSRVMVVREYLFKEFPINGKALSPVLLEKVKAELLKILSATEAEATLDMVRSGQLDELLQTFGVSFSLLESLVYAALYKKQEAGVLLYSDGVIVPWLDEMVGMGPEGQQVREQTHVFLSITQHLKEFILDEEKAAYIPRLSLLSDEELQVVRAIRSRSFREVTLTFDTKQGLTLRTTADGFLEEELSKELITALALKNYQSVDLENRGGSRLHFTKEHRRRL